MSDSKNSAPIPQSMSEVVDFNQRAWDAEVERKVQWTIPVSPEDIAKARNGEWKIILTPTAGAPREWFGDLEGKRVLCMAGSGGQQAALLAAAGARVTSFDLSERQLAQDRLVAEREGLEIVTVQGDMRDMSALADESFDLIVNPCSVCFVPDVLPIWREAARVLVPGGELMSGFYNPATWIFDWELQGEGVLVIRHKLPYSDLESLPEKEVRQYLDADEPLIFSHTLTKLVGGQLAAGFVLVDIYEDTDSEMKLSEHMPPFLATRARKV